MTNLSISDKKLVTSLAYEHFINGQFSVWEDSIDPKLIDLAKKLSQEIKIGAENTVINFWEKQINMATK